MKLPNVFRELLEDSLEEPTSLALAAAVDPLLSDNKLEFFPDYTDHGVGHVEDVLLTASRLVPNEVWASDVLAAPDAAVLIGAVLVHDLALHIRTAGFLELIQLGSRFRPLPWFSDQQPGRKPDEPWPELWQDFQVEARHFTASQLDLLLGPNHAGVPKAAYTEGDEIDPRAWTDNDRRLIGEFLRRHHARLAHEIALYGFPGAGRDLFPVLSQMPASHAHGVGVVARSHGERLRIMAAYLSYRAGDSHQVDGAYLMYAMALLRVADYLQIERKRAPLQLLRLRDPQSPVSVSEWHKHQAVDGVSWVSDDPNAIFVEVSAEHTLRTHLQLAALLEDLQRELDLSTAILSETYGRLDPPVLRLSRQRIKTNLDTPALWDQLPYVPKRAALRSDHDLFRLFAFDLYGNQPWVAGRELLQNSLDAVRALEARAGGEERPRTRTSPEIPIRVEIVDHPGGDSTLTVIDRGIGMTAETIIRYFLTAGASISHSTSPESMWRDRGGLPYMRSGRFGIGALAGFLLGSEISVTTRHVEQRRGISFRSNLSADLVELRWADDAPVGTRVDVRFPTESASLGKHAAHDPTLTLLRTITSYSAAEDPAVEFVHVSAANRRTVCKPETTVPTSFDADETHWRQTRARQLDHLAWSVYPELGRLGSDPRVAHNGLWLMSPRQERPGYEWSRPPLQGLLHRPSIAIFDTSHAVGITLARDSLSETVLPFEDDLLLGIGRDLVAFSLVHGARAHPLARGWAGTPAFSRSSWVPLLPTLCAQYVRGRLIVLWEPPNRTEGRQVSTALEMTMELMRATDFAAVVPIVGDSGETDLAQWYLGFSLGAVRRNAWHAQETLGMAATTVALARRVTAVAANRLAHPPGYDDAEWTWDHLTAGDTDLVRFAAGSRAQADMAFATEIATEALFRTRAKAIALSVFRPSRARSEDLPDAPLASPWASRLDGAMPVARDSCLELRRELCGLDPEIERSCAAWLTDTLYVPSPTAAWLGL